MKRRRLLLLALALLLVATFFLPPVYWRVAGCVKGEAFYQGRPTSWWAQEIRAAYIPAWGKSYRCVHPGEGDGPNPPSGWEAYQTGWVRKACSAWYQVFLPERFGTIVMEAKPHLTDGDEKALAVLLELLRSDDAKVRQLAVWGLGELGRAAESALPAIREACDDADEDVRIASQRARHRIEGKWDRKVEDSSQRRSSAGPPPKLSPAIPPREEPAKRLFSK